MKELSLRQAYKALLNGDIVEDNNGKRYAFDNGRDAIVTPAPGGGWMERVYGLHSEATPFTIYKPQPKSLSFEEAVEIHKSGTPVIIKTPFWGDYALRSPGCKIDRNELSFLDLAERRNWLISKEGE